MRQFQMYPTRRAASVLLIALSASSLCTPSVAGGYDYSDPWFRAGKNACRLALFTDVLPAGTKNYLAEVDNAEASRLNFCECVGQIYAEQGGGLQDDMERANTSGEVSSAREAFLIDGLDLCYLSLSQNYQEPVSTPLNRIIDIDDANDFGQDDDHVRNEPKPLAGDTIFKITGKLTWSRKTHFRICREVVEGRSSQNILTIEAINTWSSSSEEDKIALCQCVSDQIHNSQEAIEATAFSHDAKLAYVNNLAIQASDCGNGAQ